MALFFLVCRYLYVYHIRIYTRAFLYMHTYDVLYYITTTCNIARACVRVYIHVVLYYYNVDVCIRRARARVTGRGCLIFQLRSLRLPDISATWIHECACRILTWRVAESSLSHPTCHEREGINKWHHTYGSYGSSWPVATVLISKTSRLEIIF